MSRFQRIKNWWHDYLSHLSFLAIFLVLGITAYILITSDDTCKEVLTSDQAYKCSVTVAVPMVENEDGYLTPDYSGCLLSNNAFPFRHAQAGGVSLVSNHLWKTGQPFQSIELRYLSNRHKGEEPNLFDFVIEDTFDPSKCRWTCDPKTEKFCKE